MPGSWVDACSVLNDEPPAMAVMVSIQPPLTRWATISSVPGLTELAPRTVSGRANRVTPGVSMLKTTTQPPPKGGAGTAAHPTALSVTVVPPGTAPPGKRMPTLVLAENGVV